MTRKKIACVAATAFFGAVFVASAGDAYKYEATNEWFSVTAAEAVFSDGRWTKPADCEAEVVDTLIEFDAEADSPLKYTPADASGPVALVNLRILVTANATTPTLEGLDNAQAALTVVTNTTSGGLNWVGLAKVSDTTQWVTLSGAAPTAGDEYDVEIALDNRTEKKIRYSVKGTGDASYTVLTYGGDAWLGNPQSTDRVTSVAFAGTGSVGNFGGKNLVDDGATVSAIADAIACDGYDFTNGTLTATVTLPGGSDGTAKTAVLTVKDFATGVENVYTSSVSGDAGTATWNLANLTAGGVYSYTMEVKVGNEVRATKSGSFVAAIANCWFGAENNVVTNGTLSAATFDTDRWNVSGDATFDITDKAPGSNAVSRVDTKYSFETFVDEQSLEELEGDAVGGIVAVSANDVNTWRAYTTNNTWLVLSGSVTPAVSTEYTVRAEFDFMSPTKRMRYSVSTDGGANFAPLAYNGNDWIMLAKQEAGTLSSVGMSGKGYVKSIDARVADKSVIVDVTGKKFATIWDAIKSGTGPFTLRTNATLAPSGTLEKKAFQISNEGSYDFIYDGSQAGKWKLIKRDGVYYLMKPGATYIFF